MESGNPPSFRKLWEAVRELRKLVGEQKLLESPNIRISRLTQGQRIEIKPIQPVSTGNPSEVTQYIIDTISDDYLICREFVQSGYKDTGSSVPDGYSTGDQVRVYKPWLLRRSTYAGKQVTIDGTNLSYDHVGAQERRVAIGANASIEVQVIVPRYKNGDVIHATTLQNVNAESGDGVSAMLVDLNTDARAWARKAYQ